MFGVQTHDGEDGGNHARLVHRMLLQSGARFNYIWNQNVILNMKRDLFRALSGFNEEYSQLFFPGGLPSIPENTNNDPFILSEAQGIFEGAEYTHEAHGKPCGHAFKKGEGIYRCRNCAIDDTCVLCSRCFHSSDHRGHDITFSINQGTGGCCDCGDPEAWRLQFNCAYHSPLSGNEKETGDSSTVMTSVPNDLRMSIHATLSATLQFILETLATSPSDMSRAPKDKQEIFEDELKTRQANPSFNSERTDLYSVVLWNDEKHSFEEVINRLMDVVGCTEEEGRIVASHVDDHGRHIVETSSDLNHLLDIGKRTNQIDLAITIRSARDVFREELSGLLINWMKDLAASRIGNNSWFIREAICQELCQTFDSRFPLVDFQQVDLWHNRSDPSDIPTRYYEIRERLRIDALLLNDIKLWKEARNDLRELYISTLVVSPEFKKVIGVRFAAVYPQLANAFLIPDREPEHSVLLFSVQLLTVPTIARLVVEKYGFLTHIFQILFEFFTTNGAASQDPNGGPLKVNCNSASFANRRYFQIFHDLRYVICTSAVQDLVPKNPVYLSQFLDLITLFQGMNPQKRYLGSHVEYETDVWVNAFNLTLQLSKACRQMADCYATADTLTLCAAIRQTIKAIREWETQSMMVKREDGNFMSSPISSRFHSVELGTLEHVTSRCVNFNVACELISFHYPLHWVLGMLLQYLNKLEQPKLEAAGYGNLTEVLTGRNSSNMEMISLILDVPLRLHVLMAQIKGNIWVRNGYGIRGQAHHYSDNNFRQNTFDTDLFLLQVFTVTHSYNTPILTILDRFDVLSWLQPSPVHHTYDKAQVLHMAEECLSTLIHIVNERAFLGQWTTDMEIQREIIHGLCLGPKPYSELCKSIPERLVESPKFDEILLQVATFRAPTGVNETGMYRLKDECFEDVDPYFFHYTRNQREEALSILRKRKQQLGSADMVIVPKPFHITSGPFVEIGNILHTPAMLHTIFYTLLGSITGSSSDVMVEMSCHLIMLAITDKNVFKVQNDALENGHNNYLMCLAAHTVFLRIRGNPASAITLIELIHILNSIEKQHNAHPELAYILSYIGKHGCPRAKEMVAQYADTSDKNPNKPSEDEALRKKKLAEERRAKIMQQFAQAQQTFLHNNEDLLDDEDWEEMEGTENEPRLNEASNEWHYPSGTCIVCQEETDSSSIYGMLGYIQESHLLRTTPFEDTDFVVEALQSPRNMDRSAGDIRPFGVAANTKNTVYISGAGGVTSIQAQVSLSKGFPQNRNRRGLNAVSCGHLMHVECFESYYVGVELRRPNNPLRNPPEIPQGKEYLCPLCKSLNNVLLPIIWKGHTETYPGILKEEISFNQWVNVNVGLALSKLEKSVTPFDASDVNSYGSNRSRQSDGGAIKMRESISSFVSQVLTSPISSSFDALFRRHVRAMDEDTEDPDEFVFNTTRQFSAHRDAELIQRMYLRMYDVVHRAEEGVLPETLHLGSSARQRLQRPDLFWTALGYTISCIEIAYRGTANVQEGFTTAGSTLIAGLSGNTCNLIRTLSETVLTYTSMVVSGDDAEAANLRHHYLRRAKQIFGGHPTVRDPHPIQYSDTLLDEDTFLLLAETTMYMIPSMNLDPLHFMRLLYIAEIVKIVVAVVDSVLNSERGQWVTDPRMKEFQEQLPVNESVEISFEAFVRWIMSHTDRSELDANKLFHAIRPRMIMAFLQIYSLPFLRKSVLLMYARFAVKFPEVSSNVDPTWDEHTRLSKLLFLPSLETICQAPDLNSDDALTGIVSGWCQALAFKRRNASGVSISIEINHPVIFELVGLPYRLDMLIEESNQHICKRCKTCPADPAFCLICGEVLCFQAFCCLENGKGECHRHAKACGGDYGIFMRVKKCALVYLHDTNGTYLPSPYLDSHGEVDINMRRGRPQYLFQKRYDDVRKAWLQHGVPSFVARRLDSTQDPGGWTTF